MKKRMDALTSPIPMWMDELKKTITQLEDKNVVFNTEKNYDLLRWAKCFEI